MASRTLTALAVCACTLAVPGIARAQGAPLSQLLVDLIQSDVRLAPPQVGQSHEAHFIPGADQQLAPYLFNQQLLVQIGTFPLGSPSGGFSYVFDEASGTFQRTADSFGPAFAERALTLGRNRLSVGVSFQYSKYNSFEGADLRDGDVKFYLRHQEINNFFFEGDVVEAALDLDVSSATTTLSANYGLTNNWDIAVALPIQRVTMDATVDARVLRLATGAGSTIHQFPNGTTEETFTASGSASGIGDVLLRTKYRFLSLPGGGVAAGLDVRLPTGDDENLLGTGGTQATFSFIWSSTNGRFAPHFNAGYTVSSSGDLVTMPNEVGFRAGTELLATPRVTLSADLIGRTLIDAGRLEFGEVTHSYMDSLGTELSTTFTELETTGKSLSTAALALGGKFNVTGALLVNANVLFGLSSRGLTARITPIIGFDYSF